jgi:starch phosphorylase
MVVHHDRHHLDHILHDTRVRLNIPIGGKPVYVAVRELREGVFGNCRVLFLDTDIPENENSAEGSVGRTNTIGVYGGSRAQGANIDRKVAHSLILGRGSVLAPRALGIDVALYDIQESHAVFAVVELVREACHGAAPGTEQFGKALKHVRSRTLFTTHTPVKAGNPEYSLRHVHWLSGYDEDLLRAVGCTDEYEHFKMAEAGRYLAGITKAVSRRHLGIAQKLLSAVKTDAPFTYITNGQHCGYWQHPDFRAVGSAEEFERVKKAHVRWFAEQVRRWTGGRCWSEREEDGNAYTIGWCSRFATYKRPELLRTDPEWLIRFLKEKRARLFVAGKPHPDDDRMIRVWNEWYKLSEEEPRIAVVPGYELDMMQAAKRGLHLVVKTPRAPDEACGTWGMGGDMNGTLSLAPPDGWYLEKDQGTWFPFGSNGVGDHDQDSFDADELRRELVVTHRIFSEDPSAWYDKALKAKYASEDRWSADRMFRQNIELYETLRGMGAT